jgi:hypothetical protein
MAQEGEGEKGLGKALAVLGQAQFKIALRERARELEAWTSGEKELAAESR